MSPHTRRQFIERGANAFWFALGGVAGYFFERRADSILDPTGLRIFPGLVSQQAYKGSVILGSPRTVPDPPDVEDDGLQAWAESRNGIDATHSDVHISIQARELPLSLDRVRIVVSKKTQPPSGVYVGPKGAGGYFIYSVVADLDKEPVDVQEVSDHLPEWSFPVLIDPHTVFDFSVVAITGSFLVEWWIELDYTLEGVERVEKVMDGHKPYVVTSTSAATHHWNHQERRWVES